MDEASNGGDGDCNSTNLAFARICLVAKTAQTQSAVNAVAGHVADANKGNSKYDTDEDNGAFPIPRPGEDVLEVVKLASRSRHRLLDAIDDVARHVETVFEEHMRSAQTVYAAAKPQKHCDGRAFDTFHDHLRAVENTRSCEIRRQLCAITAYPGSLIDVPIVRLIKRQVTSINVRRKGSSGALVTILFGSMLQSLSMRCVRGPAVEARFASSSGIGAVARGWLIMITKGSLEGVCKTIASQPWTNGDHIT